MYAVKPCKLTLKGLGAVEVLLLPVPMSDSYNMRNSIGGNSLEEEGIRGDWDAADGLAVLSVHC